METPTVSHITGGRPHLVEHRGEAMGSSLHVIACGEQHDVNDILARAVDRVSELEQRWSRFIATSEVSVLNASPGEPVVVSDDTMELIRRALEARDLSGGRFDPTLLQAIQANGYDRTFVSIKTPVGSPALDTRRIGLGEITVDPKTHTVTFGPTTGFDPGGIGKGLAADLVAEEMVKHGAIGALVAIGGDIRCIGQGPADGGWVIAVGDTVAGVPNKTVALHEGAVASSTSRRRRWTCTTARGINDVHHLLNPATGRPAASAANFVTVIAARCSDAEWLATAIAANGSLDSSSTIIGNATAMLTDCNGRSSCVGDPERFLR
jgi:thiamine biosynthesis lipoprotein